MAYSISQISNVVRTYNQQLRVKPSLAPQRQPAGRTANGEDRVNISSEGRRLLDAAEARLGTVSTLSRQATRGGV